MFNLKAQQFRNEKPHNSNEIKLTSDSAAILKVGLEHTGIVFSHSTLQSDMGSNIPDTEVVLEVGRQNRR